MQALVLGIASGVSLPLGSVLGVKFSPVRDEICAAMMALGAGSLLFAVTVELYGHALHELRLGVVGLVEVLASVAAAVGGALFYMSVNRSLEAWINPAPDGSLDAGRTMALGSPRAEAGGPAVPYSEGRGPAIPARGFHSEVESAASSQSHPPEVDRSSRSAPLVDDVLSTPTGWRPSLPTPPAARRMSSFGSQRPSQMAIMNWEELRRAQNHQAADWSPRPPSAADSCPPALFGKKFRGRQQSMMVVADSYLEDEPLEPPQEEEEEGPVFEKVNSKVTRARSVAMALFLGLLIDGVPEGALMGFLAAEGHLSPVFIISLFIANFPEAFSSSSLLVMTGMPTAVIVGMWTSLCLLVGLLAGLSCWLLLLAFPNYGPGLDGLPVPMLMGISLAEGLTGGAMLACISSVMLPEAFERAGKEGRLVLSSGFLCTCGFLLAVTLKALGG